MSKLVIALAAAATIATGTLATPQTAQARCVGCAIGAGIVAGAVLGAAVAHAAPYGHYGYRTGYYSGPVYAGSPCSWQKEKYWDGYRWRWQRTQVCY